MTSDAVATGIPERRWMLVSHVLFGVTLGVPTIVTAVTRPPGAVGTVVIASAFALWYVTMFATRPDWEAPTGRTLVYAAGALALYTMLNVRDGGYFLLLYALFPQFFSSLPRWLAVVGVAGIVLLPAAVGDGIRALLTDRDALFSVLASVGLGLAVTAMIDALDAQAQRQAGTIDELERTHAENVRLTAEAARQGRAAGVLAERQRLAHDIHDTLAQGFTSIVTQLEAAEQALSDDRTTSAAHIARAKQTARDSLREARRTVEALRPEPLERVPLPDALRDLAARWCDGRPDAPEVAVIVDGTPAPLPPGVDDTLLRVSQEALTNVGRHAAAAHVDLTLSYLDDLVLLDVQDDGVGFDVDAVPSDDDVTGGGYGLTSMRERVALIGGALVIESAPRDGTTVAARIPRPPPPVQTTRKDAP